MEEGRNIPLIIMLSAGSIISIACIIYKFSLMETLLLVLGTLIVFYILGLIVKKLFFPLTMMQKNVLHCLRRKNMRQSRRNWQNRKKLQHKKLLPLI